MTTPVREVLDRAVEATFQSGRYVPVTVDSPTGKEQLPPLDFYDLTKDYTTVPRDAHGQWTSGGGDFPTSDAGLAAMTLDVRSREPRTKDGQPITADTHLVVYHGTDRATAALMRHDGIDPEKKPWTLASERYEQGEDATFAPGAGVGRGLYVAATPNDASGYGRAMVAVVVRAGDLVAPPEFSATPGATPLAGAIEALRFGDVGAMFTGSLAPGAVRLVESERGSQYIPSGAVGEFKGEGWENEPRDERGRWAAGDSGTNAPIKTWGGGADGMGFTTDHPQYLYHRSKTTNRDSIRATGLEAGRSLHGTMHRVYLAFEEPHLQPRMDTAPGDVWRVDTRDIPLRPDPEAPDHWAIAEQDIPPERVEFVSTTAPKVATAKYSDDEPRDERGRWTSGGGGDSATSPTVGGWLAPGTETPPEVRAAEKAPDDVAARAAVYNDVLSRIDYSQPDGLTTLAAMVAQVTGTEVDLPPNTDPKYVVPALAEYCALREHFRDVPVMKIDVLPPGAEGQTLGTIMWTTMYGEPPDRSLAPYTKITLSEAWFSKGNTNTQYFGKPTDGFHPPGLETPSGSMTHEFGHAVYAAVGAGVPFEWREMPSVWPEDRGNFPVLFSVAPPISGYGQQGGLIENWAETFSAAYDPGSRAKDDYRAEAMRLYLEDPDRRLKAATIAGGGSLPHLTKAEVEQAVARGFGLLTKADVTDAVARGFGLAKGWEDVARDDHGRWTSGGGGDAGPAFEETPAAGGFGPAPATINPSAPVTSPDHWPAIPEGGETEKMYRDASGNWTPDRQALHDYILNKFDGEANGTIKPNGPPTLYMTGGGSASGKSTILNSGAVGFPDKDHAVHADPDAVKEMIPEFQRGVTTDDTFVAGKVHEESSGLGKQIVRQGLGKGYDVVYDTTGDGSHESLAAKIAGFRAAGAGRVVGDYAFPGSVETAIARANERGAITGRYVREDVIRANHAGVADVWQKAALAGSFDSLRLWDTSGPKGSTPTIIATASGGHITVVNHAAWDNFTGKTHG